MRKVERTKIKLGKKIIIININIKKRLQYKNSTITNFHT